MTRTLWIVPTAALFASGCDWERCDRAETNFELPKPGDALEIRIRACTDRRQGDLSISMTLTAEGTPTSPLALTVDGIQLWPTGAMTWANDGVFSDMTTDADCDPGKVITLRRLDADPAISYTGSLAFDMSAPPLRSCNVTVSVTPL